MQTCCMDGQCLKYFLYVVLNEKKTVSKFDEGFIKNYGEDSNKGYIIDVDIEKTFLICIEIYHSYHK